MLVILVMIGTKFTCNLRWLVPEMLAIFSKLKIHYPQSMLTSGQIWFKAMRVVVRKWIFNFENIVSIFSYQRRWQVNLVPNETNLANIPMPRYTNSKNKKVIGCKIRTSYCESQFMTSSFFEFWNSFLSGSITGNSKSHFGIIISDSTKIENILKLHWC